MGVMRVMGMMGVVGTVRLAPVNLSHRGGFRIRFTHPTRFYQAKIETAKFYMNLAVPHALATAQIIKSNERTALDFKPEWF